MILCGGDALIDFVPVKAPDGGTAFQPQVGGAVLNAATALRRMGEEASFVGGISQDLFGDILADHMAREGIRTDHVTRSAADSTLAFVTLDGGDAKYAFYDQTSAGRMWEGAADVPRSAAALHLGSVTLIARPSADSYAQMAETLSPHMVVSLDPNCRPGLITERKGYCERIERIAAVSHLIRFSDEDFEYLYPNQSEEGVAQALLVGTTALVLISRGEQGATAFWSGGRLDFPARAAKLVDTIGAGDTFHAGVLAGLSQRDLLSPDGLAGLGEDGLKEVLAFATCAAALNCEVAGCNPPRRSRIVAHLEDQQRAD